MVRLSCGVQCTRTVLFVVNILFLLCACSILGMGIHIKINRTFSPIIAADNIKQAFGRDAMRWIGAVMIIVGGSTACLTAFGCLGALCHNRVFLYGYSIILSLIIVLQFTGAILTLRFRNDLWESYDSGFENIFQRAYRSNQTETIQIIERLEREFKCCGIDGLTDYVQSDYRIPLSCYPNQIKQEISFHHGCAEAIVIWVWNELPTIAGVLGSILFIELFGIISSLVLGVAISHSSEANAYYKL